MSKAVVDPGEVRRFAQDLKRFVTQSLAQAAALQSSLNDLGQTWRDQEFKKFSEDFEPVMKALGRIGESAEKYVPYLLRKAEKIEEYLNQR